MLLNSTGDVQYGGTPDDNVCTPPLSPLRCMYPSPLLPLVPCYNSLPGHLDFNESGAQWRLFNRNDLRQWLLLLLREFHFFQHRYGSRRGEGKKRRGKGAKREVSLRHLSPQYNSRYVHSFKAQKWSLCARKAYSPWSGANTSEHGHRNSFPA